jgi:hypothetical protein
LAVIAGFIFGWSAAAARLSYLRRYCNRALESKETIKIAIEFCTEVAVLVAVFPILDTLIGSGGTGIQRTSVLNVLFGSLAIAAIFFIFAIIMAVRKEG